MQIYSLQFMVGHAAILLSQCWQCLQCKR